LTNPLLNMFLGIFAMLCGKAAPLALVLCLEALVVLSEGYLMRRMLPEKRYPFLLSLVYNAASYLFGVVLFSFFPSL